MFILFYFILCYLVCFCFIIFYSCLFYFVYFTFIFFLIYFSLLFLFYFIPILVLLLFITKSPFSGLISCKADTKMSGPPTLEVVDLGGWSPKVMGYQKSRWEMLFQGKNCSLTKDINVPCHIDHQLVSGNVKWGKIFLTFDLDHHQRERTAVGLTLTWCLTLLTGVC